MTSLMFTGLIVQDGTATGVPQSGTGSTSRQDSKQDPPTTDDVTNKERDTSRRGFSEVILSVWSVW